MPPLKKGAVTQVQSLACWIVARTSSSVSSIFQKKLEMEVLCENS